MDETTRQVIDEALAIAPTRELTGDEMAKVVSACKSLPGGEILKVWSELSKVGGHTNPHTTKNIMTFHQHMREDLLKAINGRSHVREDT